MLNENELQNKTPKVKQLFLFGSVKDLSVERIIRDIHNHMEEESTKPQEERRDVIINIASNGGDVTCGLALATFILDNNADDNSVIKIHTHIAKSALSIAFVIWLCGERRSMSSYALGMYHDISYEIRRTTIREHDEKVQSMKMNRDVIVEIMSSRSNLSKKEINSNINIGRTVYLNREELEEIIK